jgi:hypothetical protein
VTNAPAEPQVHGWTTGAIQALRVNAPRPRPVVSDQVLRVRRAAAVALRRYPAPIGAVLASTLMEYAEQGWVGDPAGLSERLVTTLLTET